MMLMSHNLQAFLAVTRTGTVVGAAKTLSLTQTAVTQRIKSLERDIGTSLFLRNRKGMSLTHEGEALLQYCLQALELEGRVFAKVGGGIELSKVAITIAGPTSILSSRIVKQTSMLHGKFPQLRLNFLIDDSENRLTLLKSGKIQLAVLRPEEVANELESKVLQPENYILVGHPKWKHRRLDDILSKEKIIDFHKDDPTTINYLKHFGLMKQIVNDRIYANENRALLELLCQGVGYGTLTREIADEYISMGRVGSLNQGKAMKEPLALAWYSRREMPDYFKQIIIAIK